MNFWQRITSRWRRRAQPPTEQELTGRWGEEQAARHLKHSGYKILGRRVRPNRRDEIDIVARRGRLLVFVEVKTRRSERFGRPMTAIRRRERQALCRAAAAWLRRARYPQAAYRYDVIEVIGSPDTPTPAIRHIENAFPLNRRFPL